MPESPSEYGARVGVADRGTLAHLLAHTHATMIRPWHSPSEIPARGRRKDDGWLAQAHLRVPDRERQLPTVRGRPGDLPGRHLDADDRPVLARTGVDRTRHSPWPRGS